VNIYTVGKKTFVVLVVPVYLSVSEILEINVRSC